MAAFIVVAIIAAVLLVTSVRSQAAPSWFRPQNIPSAVADPVTEPHLWGPVTSGVHQVVHGGVALVRQAAADSDADDQARTEAVVASTSVDATPRGSRSTTHPVKNAPAHHSSTKPQGPASPAQHPADDGASDGPGGARTAPSGQPTSHQGAPAHHDHGRHLGWAKHHGQGDQTTEPPADAPDEPAAEPAHGQGHANGHSDDNGDDNGHDNGHGHGHAYGHAKH